MKVKYYDGNNFMHLNWDEKIKGTPPACYDCAHRTYDKGSWCSRAGKAKAFNVITGETETLGTFWRCQDQRYATGPKDCGLEGKFFKMGEEL